MSKTSQDVVITCATRTGIGKYNGMWNKVQAHDLGKLVIKDLLKQTAIAVSYTHLTLPTIYSV